jgi:hypothetical protein
LVSRATQRGNAIAFFGLKVEPRTLFEIDRDRAARPEAQLVAVGQLAIRLAEKFSTDRLDQAGPLILLQGHALPSKRMTNVSAKTIAPKKSAKLKSGKRRSISARRPM